MRRTIIMFSASVMCIYSSDDSKDVSSKGPSITSIPKEGSSVAKLSKEPIPKELLAWYGYDIVEDYLPVAEKPIPKELLAWYGYDIVEDYLPVAEKPIPKVIFKSPNLIKRCVLGLANIEKWDNIVKKYGIRTPGRCKDKSKGKRKIPVTGCVLRKANVTTRDEIEKKMGLADLIYTCNEIPVERELAISKESVSKIIRWISYGPHATVVKYDAYNINRYTFRTKCHDGKVYQNSGVSVEAIDLHISKEVTTTRQAFYYGVLQEIWVLDYRFSLHLQASIFTLHLQIAYAHCICSLHLQARICTLHLHIAFAG
nr:hypothetical protein [Tanacetum cinerariifolium]